MWDKTEIGFANHPTNLGTQSLYAMCIFMHIVIDAYGRMLKGIRISLTQRCNLSCFYCHAEGQKEENNTLSLNEIKILAEHLAKLGIENVKLTGGEPLLRDDIVQVVEVFAEKKIVPTITTNGTLLASLASELAGAGATRVNVNLPSIEPETYKQITGMDLCEKVIAGCIGAKKSGLGVKINMVLLKGINDDSVHFNRMLDFAQKNGLALQIIELEKVNGTDNGVYMKYHAPLEHLEKYVSTQAVRVRRKTELHNTKIYTMPDGTDVEFVAPMENHDFCMHCTRLRITSSGKIKPCLFLDDTIDVRKYLNNFEEFRKVVEGVWLSRKPHF